jgi:hypothetical protein
MKLSFGFGAGTQEAEVPEGNLLGVLHANEVALGLTGEAEVRRALADPIGSPRLGEIVRPGEKIAIVTSDITRPMPTYKVMPALLDELYAAGVKGEDITLVFALGSHRKHTDEERKHLAGERAWNEIACVDSDPADCVHMGVTAAGTPVDITRVVAEADRRICLGNIEYHYFAGYSGGAKAIMPGASTRDAIQSNHAMLTAACAGQVGMKCILVLKKRGELTGGNLILDNIFGAEVRLVDTDSYDDVYAEMDRIMEQLRAQGHTPYAIPVGGSVPLGSLGYVNCVKEIAHQTQELGVTFDAVVSAAGSGGTYAGLTLGAKLFLPGIRSIGIGVCDDPFVEIAMELTTGAAELLETDIRVTREDIRLCHPQSRGLRCGPSPGQDGGHPDRPGIYRQSPCGLLPAAGTRGL